MKLKCWAEGAQLGPRIPAPTKAIETRHARMHGAAKTDAWQEETNAAKRNGERPRAKHRHRVVQLSRFLGRPLALLSLGFTFNYPIHVQSDASNIRLKLKELREVSHPT